MVMMIMNMMMVMVMVMLRMVCARNTYNGGEDGDFEMMIMLNELSSSMLWSRNSWD